MRDLRGLVGWPGEFMGGWGGGRDCRGRGSLGSGATRTWPPPWPLLGLPPPVGQRGQNRVRPSRSPAHGSTPAVWREGGGGGSSPRWSWPRRSQSGSPRLPLPRHSPLPSWSSCPPSYRSQPFLSTGGRREHRQHPRRGGEQSHSGPGGGSYLCCLLGLWFRLGLGRFL